MLLHCCHDLAGDHVDLVGGLVFLGKSTGFSMVFTMVLTMVFTIQHGKVPANCRFNQSNE